MIKKTTDSNTNYSCSIDDESFRTAKSHFDDALMPSTTIELDNDLEISIHVPANDRKSEFPQNIKDLLNKLRKDNKCKITCTTKKSST